MPTFHVRFGLTPEDERCLLFGARLASSCDEPLYVWVPNDPAARRLLKKQSDAATVYKERDAIHVHVRRHLDREGLGTYAELLLGDPWDGFRKSDAILIGSPATTAYSTLTCIVPKDETDLRARGDGSICVPLGNGDSARRVAAFVLPLAARLGVSVVFYHTTWLNPKLPAEAAPERHMLPEVVEHLRAMRAEAAALGVSCEAVVEAASTIDDGILRFALHRNCSLIAMARSVQIGRGSHVDQALARSVIPVLVVGRSAQ